jgi:hypothetical protein
MRIRRAIISPLVTLGLVGGVLAGIAVPLATAAASSTPVASGVSYQPDWMHIG